MRSLVAMAVAALVAVSPGIAVAAEKSSQTMEIYKHPLCGCCSAYADLARAEGYAVTVRETEDLAALKRRMGIPDGLQSCHTTLIDGYVVEGHVPFGVLARLLKERPRISGVALPDMPTGSPGMPGPRSGPFTIYEIGPNKPRVYAVD